MPDSSTIAQIDHALDLALEALEPFTAGDIESTLKEGDDPLTEADLAVNAALREALMEPGYGWLSEETADSVDERRRHRRVWVVDPIDGTREFVAGIPEWCVSVGFVEDGRAVAGGILNPATGERIVGAVGMGVTLNRTSVSVSQAADLRGALVLASRSEVKRGEWDRFFREPISIRNMGSVAYKLGLVAAGLADATWTLVPKHEWDVAAGAALVLAAGGVVLGWDGKPPEFNRADPKMRGFVAAAPGVAEDVRSLLGL